MGDGVGYPCSYCGEHFDGGRSFHEEYECDLNPDRLKNCATLPTGNPWYIAPKVGSLGSVTIRRGASEAVQKFLRKFLGC